MENKLRSLREARRDILKTAAPMLISWVITAALIATFVLGICLFVGYGHQLDDRYGAYFARAKSAGTAEEMQTNLQIMVNNLEADGYSSGELAVTFKNKGNDASLMLANITNTIDRLEEVKNNPDSTAYQMALQDARTNLTSSDFPNFISRIHWNQRWWALLMILIGIPFVIIALAFAIFLTDDSSYDISRGIDRYKNKRAIYKSDLEAA